MFTVKKANSDSRHEVEGIMSQILAESPKSWPHGLSMDLFEEGRDSIYMVRSASTNQPAGFVGWQEREERDCLNQPIKIGYYAIGMLPEFRRQGMAKDAVAGIIRHHQRGVDEVRAMIQKDNAPSLKLAESLNVPVEKVAFWKALVSPVARRIYGGLGSAGAMDYLTHGTDYSHIDGRRVLNTAVNAGLGALGAHYSMPHKGMGGVQLPGNPAVGFNLGVLSPIGKDIMMNVLPATHKLAPALEAITGQANRGPTPATPTTPEWSPLAKAGLIGALGLGAFGLHRLSKSVSNAAEANNQGRLQVRLPTRHPGDQETTVDVPVSDANLTGGLKDRIFRDTRRKLRQESKERTWHRGDKHRLLSNDEDEDGMEKVAACFMWLVKEAGINSSEIQDAGNRLEAAALATKTLQGIAPTAKLAPLARGLGRMAPPVAAYGAVNEFADFSDDPNAAMRKFWKDTKRMSPAGFAYHSVTNPITATASVLNGAWNLMHGRRVAPAAPPKGEQWPLRRVRQPETMVVAPHTPAATGAKPNPGIYKAHQAPNFTGPTNPTSVVKSGGGNVGGMMTAMPTKPIPTIQFASSIKGPGETEDPQAKMEQEKEQAEQVKQLEAAQADSNTHKSTLAEMKEHQHSERMQMREQLMAHQQKLHEMKLENASLRAKADMASSMPEPQEHHGAKHVTDYAKQLHDKATSIMKKLSAVNPYYANLLWDRACKMAGVTPESGAAGEEEYYHKHNPGGFGTAMTNFGFHDKAMQDSAYNAINPTKPEAQWGMGDKMKHWGANLAAGAGWLGDALVSPFRYGTRSFLRAGSHFGEGNYGKGLMHGTLGTASAALGVIPGVGALRGGIGAGARLTGLARGMMTANIPQMAEGAKQPPAPMAPGAVAGTPTPTPGAPTSPSSDIPTMLKSWLGLSGDADATNYAGHFLPPALVSQNPGNEDSTDYKNPFLQKVMPTAMRFLTKGPAPESSMRAFAESEGSQGGIAPQEIRPGYLSPSTAMALQNTLYGGGMGL